MPRLELLRHGGERCLDICTGLPAESLLPAHGLGPLFLCWGGVLGKLVYMTSKCGEVVYSSAADSYSVVFLAVLALPPSQEAF